MKRRVALFAPMVAAGLAACGSSPPVQWYELRSAPPEAATVSATPGPVWLMSPTVVLPGTLDRDTLMVARGSAGLEPLPGHRWAEPLRDSIPRLLLADLRRLRGADRLWLSPAPPGVGPAPRLVVAIDQLRVQADRRTLAVVARATWQGPADDAAPVLRSFAFEVPIDGAAPDAVAAAHRLAVWRLAQRLAPGP